MLQTLKKLLLKIVDDIDAGNTNADEDELEEIITTLKKCLRKDYPMSKYQAYMFLNLRRAQFDNLVREGVIPKGKKVEGFNELQWFKKDLMEVKRKRNANKQL